MMFTKAQHADLHGVNFPVCVMQLVILIEVTIFREYRSKFETVNRYAALNKSNRNLQIRSPEAQSVHHCLQ